jgi:hypothetical protein
MLGWMMRGREVQAEGAVRRTEEMVVSLSSFWHCAAFSGIGLLLLNLRLHARIRISLFDT